MYCKYLELLDPQYINQTRRLICAIDWIKITRMKYTLQKKEAAKLNLMLLVPLLSIPIFKYNRFQLLFNIQLLLHYKDLVGY